MDIDTFRNYCLSKKAATEDLPFGPDTLVFKIMGKMFALTSLDEVPLRANLKCEPNKALELREEYPENILPGYHMNKTHWNTVVMDGSLSPKLIFEMVDHSYQLITSGLSKKLQEELKTL